MIFVVLAVTYVRDQMKMKVIPIHSIIRNHRIYMDEHVVFFHVIKSGVRSC